MQQETKSVSQVKAERRFSHTHRLYNTFTAVSPRELYFLKLCLCLALNKAFPNYFYTIALSYWCKTTFCGALSEY